MSWKKNVFSYVVWLGYTLMVSTALAGLGGMYCAGLGLASGWGILTAAVFLALTGGVVFLLHRAGSGMVLFAEKNKRLLLILEVLLAVALLAAGILLRINGSREEDSVYFEAAKVASGQRIPQIVHGAVYFYIQLLHGLFLLLGNQPVAGIWLQVALQLAASLGLFFVLRSLAGRIAALVTLGFCMCAPFMVQNSLALSPEILYFALLTGAAGLILPASRGKLQPVAFLFIGILCTFCCYMDISGALLLVPALGMIFCQRESTSGRGKKIAAVLLCLAGIVLGILACIFVDALLSGKSFQGVINAWLKLYEPAGFQVPFTASSQGSLAESTVLLGAMAFGIFGFWRDRRRERISVWVLGTALVIFAGCFGMFTEEMPGFVLLYILFSILAGLGMEQCFRKTAAANEEAVPEAAVSYKTEPGSEPEEDNVQKQDMAQKRDNVKKQDMAQTQDAGTFIDKETGREIKYIENPLPLPRKHVKREMDYALSSVPGTDDFDLKVSEEDDFDI